MEESADKDSENEKPAVTKLQAAEGKTKRRSPRTRTARTLRNARKHYGAIGSSSPPSPE